MTTERDLDFRLAAWLDERATNEPPRDLLDRALARAGAVRQRPSLLTRDAYAGPWFGAGRAPLAAPLVVLVVTLLLIVVVVAGAELVTTRLSTIIEPSPSPAQDREAPTFPPPAPTVPVTPAGPLGGGPILAHTYARYRDPGPFDVIALDAGTGTRTLLGTLPGKDVAGNADPFEFLRSQDLTRVVLLGRSLDGATPAAAPFGFTTVLDPGAKCCPEAVLEWITLSPEGDRIAAVRADSFDDPIEIVVLDLNGNVSARLPIPEAMNWVGPISWAPDGSAILMTGCRPCNKAETPSQRQTAHHAHLYLAPLDGTSWTELLDVDNGQLNGQWSPDGTRLAVETYLCAPGSVMPRCDPAEATSSLSILTLADGLERQLGETPRITGTTWSPDGSRIAYSDGDAVFVVDAATGLGAKVAELEAFGPDWSPDSRWLVIPVVNVETLADFDAWIVRADGTELRQILAGYAGVTW